MAKKASMKFNVDKDQKVVEVQIEILSEDSMGRDATFELRRRVRVKDSRPVHDSNTLYRHSFRTTDRSLTFTFPISKFTGFSYDGSQIDIEYQGALKIDDGIFFDTKVSREFTHQLIRKPKVSGNTEKLVEPKDRFNLFTNLRAIPIKNQVATLGLIVAGLIVIGVNTIIGVHDQMSPESQVFLYSHRDSDGDSSSPLGKSLAGSGAAGAAIWFAMRRNLRKYMKFKLHRLPLRIDRASSLPIKQLVHGRSRVDLENVTLRVVACNLEKGQYMRGSGSDLRTVSFSEPVQGVLLYTHQVDKIPAAQPVENFFPGEVKFKRMFDRLYPPDRISGTHGLFVYWEVQLLVDKLVDQELVASTDPLVKEDFYDDGS
ncbi:MAG: hypothetical protein ABGX05_18875 [Pirellulaceae bacterium]